MKGSCTKIIEDAYSGDTVAYEIYISGRQARTYPAEAVKKLIMQGKFNIDNLVVNNDSIIFLTDIPRLYKQ